MLPPENIQNFWIRNLLDLRIFLLQNVGAAAPRSGRMPCCCDGRRVVGWKVCWLVDWFVGWLNELRRWKESHRWYGWVRGEGVLQIVSYHCYKSSILEMTELVL